MERSVSVYGSSSALRGVKLKIGEKFKLPAKITLPFGWKTRDPSSILNLTYDFSLEEDVIAKAMAEKLVKEQQENAQKAKEELEMTKPVIACMGGDILQPTSATSSPGLQKEQKETFNYKDFEGDADTPFELVELQSINNMDALKSVLQPGIIEAPVATSGNTQNTQTISCDGPNDHTDHQTNSVLTGNVPEDIPTTGATNICYPPSQYLHNMLSDNRTQPVNQEANTRHDLDPFGVQGMPSGSGLNIPVSQQSSSAPNTTALLPGRRQILPGARRVLPGPPPTKPLPQRPPPRRPKSVPNETLITDLSTGDIVESDSPRPRPIPKPRSKLPPINNDADAFQIPPLPPKQSALKRQSQEYHNKQILKDGKVLMHHSSPLPPISPPQTPVSYSSKPDPLLSMSSEEIQFVHELSTMGFPLERVAGAVKIFGCKEREVVEFLILFNEMCGQGYTEDQVEMVLKEGDSDKEKAEKFLSLIVQFKELGFQEEQIFNALKESECDSNKTLDILTCAG